MRGLLTRYISFSLLLALFVALASCSKPTPYLVKNIKDGETIVLEDGTTVKLIGVNGVTEKYKQSLLGLKNNYVYLYDQNYDPIKTIYEGSIYAYVYDSEDNCINNFADGSEISSTSIGVADENPSIATSNSETQGERISGKEVAAMQGASLSELYERNKNAVFLVAVFMSETNYSQGSGFFLTKEGIGVSNYHVFEDGIKGEAYIKTIDGHQYRVGEVLRYDTDLDFIVFKVENNHYDFPYVPIAPSAPNVGEDVFAIGNPKGLEHTLSKGIVSSFRSDKYQIQTTTEITHGSSGGPLFNMNGQVVGITTSGVGEANLNFAMNIQKLGIKELIN
jgi:serine protease Do